MNSKNLLTANIGYRSTIRLLLGDRVLECRPGDLHMLTVRNLKLLNRLLDCGAVSNTGMIRRKGHELESSVITIQNLPAIQIDGDTLTGEDVRNMQSAKAKFASSVQALLMKAGVDAADVEVCIHTIDGIADLADAKQIGMIPADMKEGAAPEFAPDLPVESVDLEEPAVIRGYTNHLFFPKR